jgi:hypothetical protein
MYLQPWEWHFSLGTVCPTLQPNLIIDILSYTMLTCIAVIVMTVANLLYRTDGAAFTGNLPWSAPPPIAYPQWLMILSHYQLSNHMWILWMLLLGQIPQ